MDRQTVIARAFRGEPLKRVAISSSGVLVYLANPESLARVEAGETDPVGFPAEDVFAFDEDVFGLLRVQWMLSGETSSDHWGKLGLFREAS